MVVEDQTHNKPHVALLASPGLGHVIPLLELAKRLVIDHGCHVSFLVITTSKQSPAQDQYLQSTPLPPGLDIVNLPRVNLEELNIEGMVTAICMITEHSVKSLASVLVEIGKPQALIIDLFGTQAFSICEQLPIPVYTFVTTSVSFIAFAFYMPTLDKEIQGEYVDLLEPIQIPGRNPLRPDDVLDPARNRKVDDYKWLLLSFSRLQLASGLILNTWEDLEPFTLNSMRELAFFKQLPLPRLFPVGPLVKSDDFLIDLSTNECLTWLDKQPTDSVLFVCLGSGGTLSTEQLHELAFGLELSQQRFIFVVRAPNDHGVAFGTYFDVGDNVKDPRDYLPEGFIERTKELGLVVSEWAPQVTILGHEATGGFLSHCGWNSSLESVVNGVPMIAWPLYAEQRTNAADLEEELRVAVRLRMAESGKEVVGREEIERVVRLLMEGEEGKSLRQRTKDLKESAVKALDSGGSSYESLASLVNEWRVDQNNIIM